MVETEQGAKIIFSLAVAHSVNQYEVIIDVENIYHEKQLQTKLHKYGYLKYTHITWDTALDGVTRPKRVKHSISVRLEDDKAFRTMLAQFNNAIDSTITYRQE